MRAPVSLVMLCVGIGCGRLDFEQRRDPDAGEPPLDGMLDGATVRPNLAFITAGTYDGDLGGVAGADAACNAEASAAGRSGDFIALLWSSERPDPGALLAGSEGWVRADGAWLADSADQISIGALANPLGLTAAGDDVLGIASDGPPNRYWNGLVEGNCSDWRSTTGMGDQTWFPQWRRISDGMFDCDQRLRLTCFERGFRAQRPASPAAFKRVFLTTAELAMGGGVAAADALCESEAASAGFAPSSALIGTSTTAAIDRIPGARTTRYYRPDGVEVGLLTAVKTWINVDAAGDSLVTSVWTGGPVDEVSASTCGDWMDVSDVATVGFSWDYVDTFGASIVQSCSLTARLYCVER